MSIYDWKGEHLIRAPKREIPDPPKQHAMTKQRQADAELIRKHMHLTVIEISEATGLSRTRIADLKYAFNIKLPDARTERQSKGAYRYKI